VDSAKIDNLASQLGAVLVELARLGATVEGMRGEQQRNAVETARDLADHEVRLREVEAWRSRVIGYLAGASAVSGLSGAGLAVAVQHFLQ
jgi:hypothetical protein